MCYFDGQRAKIRQVSKRKPIKAWKAVYVYGGWFSPIYSGKGSSGDFGAWVQASAHGSYCLKSKAKADNQTRLARAHPVLLAGRVREYETGYRAEWIKVLRGAK